MNQKSRDGSGWGVWLADVNTGSTERLSDISAYSATPIHWSLDGQYVFLVVEPSRGVPARLQRLSLADRRVESFGRFQLTDWPALSPDSRLVAAVRADWSRKLSVLVVANSDGSAEREIATRPLDEPYFMPAWSPDGKTIACSVGNLSMIGRPMRIVTVRLDDGRERTLSREAWTRALAKTWLPDGRGLLVLGEKWGHGQNPDSALWRVDVDTGQSRVIYTGPDDLAGWWLSLSADGNSLAAARTRLAASIWILPGGNSHLATEIAPAWEAPRFFPDGRLVFTGHARFLWRTNADGSDRVRITAGFHKAVAPDGRSVVFSSDHGGASQIWRANADGGGAVPITHGPAASHPEVSPDGRWVLYTTAVDGALWKAPIAGGQPVKLSEGTAANATVSPDGQWVGVRYRHPAGGSWEAALVSMRAGGVSRKLPLPPGTDLWDVRFPRDGSGLDVAVSEDGVGNLWRLRLDGGPPRQLTHFTSEELRASDWSWDGESLASLRGGWRLDVLVLRGQW